MSLLLAACWSARFGALSIFSTPRMRPVQRRVGWPLLDLLPEVLEERPELAAPGGREGVQVGHFALQLLLLGLVAVGRAGCPVRRRGRVGGGRGGAVGGAQNGLGLLLGL